MKLSDFDFPLPKNLIAQKPSSPRDRCRLMILNRKTKTIKHDRFFNLGRYLRAGDILVLNDSKVLPARLWGRKETGGQVEILLLREIKSDSWECLVGSVPIRKQIGLKINFRAGLKGLVTKRLADRALIKFNLRGKNLLHKILEIGQTPTPPYIKRLARRPEYQTVFAKKFGSVAAPTAGLHFTRQLLNQIKKQGIQIKYLTLHVGLGTFQPIKIKDLRQHEMHPEYFELKPAVSRRLNLAKAKGRRIIAVGTTSAKTLETCARPVMGKKSVKLVRPAARQTNLFIYPGYRFKFVDGLITNFHLPRSTLLLLVSALAGKKFIDRAYRLAIKRKYRFYSFGDAMLII